MHTVKKIIYIHTFSKGPMGGFVMRVCWDNDKHEKFFYSYELASWYYISNFEPVGDYINGILHKEFIKYRIQETLIENNEPFTIEDDDISEIIK